MCGNKKEPHEEATKDEMEIKHDRYSKNMELLGMFEMEKLIINVTVNTLPALMWIDFRRIFIWSFRRLKQKYVNILSWVLRRSK